MFGVHISKTADVDKNSVELYDAIINFSELLNNYDHKLLTCQIFVSGPQKLKFNIDDEQIEKIKSLTKDIKIIAHGAYAAFPWNGKPYPAIFIKKELEICRRANISGLVIHLGKPDISTVIKTIPSLMNDIGPLIFLETPSVKPESSHYEIPKKLFILFSKIYKIDKDKSCFGLCVDTAHIWACGINITSFKDATAWLTEFEKLLLIIPPKNILFHLNDSLSFCGSGIDRHANIAEGTIWSGYKFRLKKSGFAAFVQFTVKYNIPSIFERKYQNQSIPDFIKLDEIINL